MKTKKMFSIDVNLLSEFKKTCVKTNDGEYSYGLESRCLAEAIRNWIDSKKVNEELIDELLV